MAIDGYNRNEHSENARLRMLTYTIAKPYLIDQNMTAYDFWPLDGDPTPDEMQEEQRERLEKEMENAKENRDRILKKFKQRNAGL